MCEPFPQSPPELWGQLSRWLEEARLEEKGHQCSLTIILISRNNSPSGGAVLLGTLKGDEMFSQDMTEMRCSSVSACAQRLEIICSPSRLLQKSFYFTNTDKVLLTCQALHIY